jgi:cytochrome c peroxidase
MMRLVVLVLGALVSSPVLAGGLPYEDVILRKIIEAYEIQPHVPQVRTLGAKERLGQALFFDPIVSGPRRIACGTCHVRSKGSADGLRMAVGLGATGVGSERLEAGDALIVPRNALPFFNRGSADFRALFWDGRVQIGAEGQKESPMGKRLPDGFENLLAVAAVFPPVEPDEMLGRSKARGTTPATYHGELVRDDVDPDNFQERTLEVWGNLMTRLVGGSGRTPNRTQERYRRLFAEAFPDQSPGTLSIAHIGNALSAYIGAAFELAPAPWDRYVEGETSALTTSQKQGAVVFFGKGRCFVCHTGRQFSDFAFHGLAIPQLRVGKHGRYVDYGRAAATSRPEDRFKFRTAPLRNVTQTGPWGHNGVFRTLREAIEHHVNPVPLLFEAQKGSKEEAQRAGRLLGYRSPLLAEITPLSDADFEYLLAFLEALTSRTVMGDDVALPRAVPSGDNQFIRK